MSTEVRHRRGTTAQHAAFTGALAEITVDTDKKTAVVHDGVTAGGIPLAREDGKNDGALGYLQEVKTNDYPVTAADIGKMLVANKATAINFPLGTAAALTSKFVAAFKNIGAGTLTITPNGTELIDGVNAAISVPTGGSLILKGDGASFRTFVSNGDVTASAIHNAASKAALADADELGVVDTAASNVLKKSTLGNLITSIFKTARTIANAQFDAASFKLFNAAGTPRALSFVTTALTADRTLTMPDANVDLTPIPTLPVTKGFTSADQTITTAGLLTIAHGLGVAPKFVTLDLVCQTAEANWSVGDVIYNISSNATTSTIRADSVSADATNVYVRFSDQAGAFLINNKTSGLAVTITAANWKLRVRAFA